MTQPGRHNLETDPTIGQLVLVHTNTSSTDPGNEAGTTMYPQPSPASVWATAQRSYAAQRGRFVPGSQTHPARMLPAIAAHAIEAYTEPGDLVLDPMCGIGTTLVAALQAGRRTLGVEIEPHWARLARANVSQAAAEAHLGAPDPWDSTRPGLVVCGDSRELPSLLPAGYRHRARLVVTSPPYGPSTHGTVGKGRRNNVVKRHWRYGVDGGQPSPRNLARAGTAELVRGFASILGGLRLFLADDARVVVTARPWREHGELIDLAALVFDAAHIAGLVPVERCVALLARISEHGELVHDASFFQRINVQHARAIGVPLHIIAHEDVLVLTTRPLTQTATQLGSAAPAAEPPDARAS